MSDPIHEKHLWQQSLLSSVLDIVQAADGDFTAVGQLAKASNDRESLQLMIERLSQYPQGKQAFVKQLRLGSVNLEQLRQLSDHTLGHIYAEHMIRNQLKPLQVSTVESDCDFLIAHLTETHDIWHVVTGSNTDIWGEIQLEAFYVAQLELSRFWMALLAKNLLKAAVYNIESSTQYMEALTKGWLMGKKAKLLFGIDWKMLWETPLEQVRASLSLYIDI